MEIDKEKFETLYGCSFPKGLGELYKLPCPIRFEFLNKPFIEEIQYFLGADNIEPLDVQALLFPFAINTDGHELILDLSKSELPVMQREFGDIDGVDTNLNDLLNAKTSKI